MSRILDQVTKAARDLLFLPVPTAAGDASLIKLDSNENPFGPSPLAMEAMRSALSSANNYPDDQCAALRSRLAIEHGVGPEQILVTPGSTGMLSLLCQTLLMPGRNAVISERSFIVYGMAVRAAGARLIEVPMRGDDFDLPGILNAVDRDTRIVLLAIPNNPTGTMIDAATLEKFLAEVPDHVVVVLDEAYCEFAARFAKMRKVDVPQSLEYMRLDAKVVVLRTFSKVHGLAGLRIGYGVGSAELIAICEGMLPTYSVSSVSQAAALAALDDREHIERTLANNTAQAQILSEGLLELGYRVVPTSANFVYCDLGSDAAAFALRLREKGVSVRPLGAWGAPTRIRVSIGTPEQNTIFLDAARKLSRRR